MLKRVLTIVFLGTTFYCPNVILAKQANSTKAPPVFVETYVAKTKSYPDQIMSTGTLISIPGIIVKPEISGRITKIYFNSGDMVSEGSLLIEINPDIIKAQLAAAQAKLRLNKLNFDRSSSLYKTHDISKSDFDQAQANYNSARANVDSMQAELQQTTIVAPFAGKLGLTQVNVGDYVSAGQSIVNLQTIDPLKVDFSVPEFYQSKVTLNQQVFLRTDAYPGKIFHGSVEAFESLINQNNRTLSIRANVPNKEAKLIPGGFVEVALQFSVQQLIMVPQTSIVYAPDGNYVFKVVAGKAEKTKVILGAKDSNNVVVKTGLKDGDVVITAGQIKVRPGSAVMVAGNKKPAD
ncbi:MAG: efflux RND transporter periplasmic adaptor subunit [Gammaproteobacteria bacterium]|nr:efflux RND transporter periplasmic adaptor subunit [Gammaproteobacteria bacterium]